jgi:poly(A) polymerase/tRNA nucleotidyltransferase (CCA-adding enzyme)
MHVDIPQPVVDVVRLLETHGFEAFVVGGSLRDLLLGREPKDWDITTNARPEAIQKIFPESVYENAFGTVGIKVGRFLKTTPEDQATDLIEVTTYRTESNYTDQRHPDIVEFVETIEEDLSRRDFTVNALAAKLNQSISISPDKASDTQLISCSLTLIDPFGGKKDLHQKIIRAVGNPTERFEEDALRILRAIRLVTELSSGDWKREKLDWTIEPSTWDALRNLSSRVGALSIERIRDEFSRIVTSSHPRQGIELLHEAHVLGYFLPELERGIGVTQNLHHIYTVWEHNLRALETCPSDKLAVRLAALFHDIGKPDTKRGEGYRATFYNHDHVGARITKRVLERLRYPKKIIDHASLLVDNHLFYYNVGEVTEASVRRLLRRVGPENMDDLMAVRIGDRLGSGVPKAKPYKLRHLEYMIDKVSRDAISVKMLKIDGKELMEKLKLKPGPKVGALLDCLLAEVIEDAKKNERDILLDRAHKLMDNDLETLRSLAKERIEEKRLEDDQNIKDVHRVQ